jgi:hypothetical protein
LRKHLPENGWVKTNFKRFAPLRSNSSFIYSAAVGSWVHNYVTNVTNHMFVLN